EAIEAGEAGIGMLRIHQARLHPLGLLLKIGRQFDIVVRLHAAVDAEGPLRENAADQQQPERRSPPDATSIHRPPPPASSKTLRRGESRPARPWDDNPAERRWDR